MFDCLSVFFVSNKRQNGWTDQANILSWPPLTPGKVYGWLKFQKLNLKAFNLRKILKMLKKNFFFIFFFSV